MVKDAKRVIKTVAKAAAKAPAGGYAKAQRAPAKPKKKATY